MDIDINFRARYLSYHDIINNITRLNNDLNIHMFHFFENDQLLYTKKMIFDYNNSNFYRISKSVLNLFCNNNYKIFYRHYIILLTDTYVYENQRLIYTNIYQDNLFRYFIIGNYYKFCSREYIHYCQHMYYQMTVGDFYYCDYYISKQEMNNIQEQLKICSKSIQLLYTL